MKLHVLVSNGHHQVSTPIKKILYICVGGVNVEISMHHPLFAIAECIYITNKTTVFSKRSVAMSITPRGCTNTGGRV